MHPKALGKCLSGAGRYPSVPGFGFLNQLSFDPAHSFLPEASAGFFPLLAEFRSILSSILATSVGYYTSAASLPNCSTDTAGAVVRSDVGSTSTKAVLVDIHKGGVLAGFYTRTGSFSLRDSPIFRDRRLLRLSVRRPAAPTGLPHPTV